jgi:hypothetical protein
MTMRALWFCLLLASTVTGVASARADDAPKPPILERTDAFRQAYGASFYQFDACGDGIAGRTWRSALVEKLKQCPYSAEARKHFQAWSAAQRRKSSQVMAKLIEDNGGLPMRLQGMTRSCHEQMDSPEYRLVRGRLDDYASGKAGVDVVVPEPCDAAEITP